MKKSLGYTLAEVLISIAVVGLIAAVLMPLINKYRPDTTKILYLKTYDSLITTINTLANSPKFYPVDEENKNSPFLNTSKVKLGDKEFGGDKEKLCELIGAFFSDDISCKTDNKPRDYVSNKDYKEDKFSPNFRAKNGVEFFLTTNETLNDSGNVTDTTTDIYFDVNGVGKGKDCMYNKESCPKPDRFKLSVADTGRLSIKDPVGKFYFDNRINWKLKDIEIAEEVDNSPRACSSAGVKGDCRCGDKIYGKPLNCYYYKTINDPWNNKYLNVDASLSGNICTQTFTLKNDLPTKEVINFTYKPDIKLEFIDYSQGTESARTNSHEYFFSVTLNIDPEDDNWTKNFDGSWTYKAIPAYEFKGGTMPYTDVFQDTNNTCYNGPIHHKSGLYSTSMSSGPNNFVHSKYEYLSTDINKSPVYEEGSCLFKNTNSFKLYCPKDSKN